MFQFLITLVYLLICNILSLTIFFSFMVLFTIPVSRSVVVHSTLNTECIVTHQLEVFSYTLTTNWLWLKGDLLIIHQYYLLEKIWNTCTRCHVCTRTQINFIYVNRFCLAPYCRNVQLKSINMTEHYLLMFNRNHEELVHGYKSDLRIKHH